ncbi:hypothetical protein XENTR_v10012714 [Xenopus tropicalis]|nr:hypothetical protein XENTR_v10012714 [Xenopus tropicalis]
MLDFLYCCFSHFQPSLLFLCCRLLLSAISSIGLLFMHWQRSLIFSCFFSHLCSELCHPVALVLQHHPVRFCPVPTCSLPAVALLQCSIHQFSLLFSSYIQSFLYLPFLLSRCRCFPPQQALHLSPYPSQSHTHSS